MKTPFLTVIIPTRGRPQYLAHAIASALLSVPDGDVEVIVVPNGPDDSWKAVAERNLMEARVQWHPIETGHANVARNYGLIRAGGKYVRFLDDDDYLLEGAQKQCIEHDESDDDVSQGGVDLVDQEGKIFRQWKSAATTDYVASMLRPTRITHNCAMLYRRDRISGQVWDPARSLAQDVAWALALARDYDGKLHRCDYQTGVWRHHRAARISTGAGTLGHNQATAEILLDTVLGLQRRGALTHERLGAAEEGLWQCVHNAFPLAPRYWTAIIRQVQSLAPDSRPSDPIYRCFPLNQINPLWVEWLMAPHRSIRMQRHDRAVKRGIISQW